MVRYEVIDVIGNTSGRAVVDLEDFGVRVKEADAALVAGPFPHLCFRTWPCRSLVLVAAVVLSSMISAAHNTC